MEKDRLIAIIEALIFASDRPLKTKYIEQVLSIVDLGDITIDGLMEALRTRYGTDSAGIELVEVAEGWQFRTRPQLSDWVKRLNIVKPAKLSMPAVETLSIVAYRQPVTHAEIDYVRGVDSGGVIKTLLDRRLIKIVGKKELPGRPLVYGTTQEFLEVFGLKDISALPSLQDIKQIGSAEEELERDQAELPLAANKPGEGPDDEE
ncbi:MAG: SMC-Scp complex subunit ScpB [Deltaproteobacteria bacterium]|nr:SMC-Scp complex subunit ScpB [Deltaproteobacteria bacterium]MCL5276562.1 SMC-Scp complex subunit ScpB [Deltaproteobacteria bacterium]